DSLEGMIRNIDVGKFRTEWIHYYKNASHYSRTADASKRATVELILDRIQPRLVYDLGGNTGEYSRLATMRGIDVICYD
ncbi:hypothetical protein ACXWPL_09995, partial [Streptococcus pyogenes]